MCKQYYNELLRLVTEYASQATESVQRVEKALETAVS